MNTRERFRAGLRGKRSSHTEKAGPWGEEVYRLSCKSGERHTAPVQWEILISYTTGLFPKEVLSAKDCPFLYALREPSATGPQLARSNRHHLLLTIRKPSHHRGASPISCKCEDRTGGGLH